MNRSECDELAKRALTCEHWRWMSGMLAIGVHGQWPMRLCVPDEDRAFWHAIGVHVGDRSEDWHCRIEIKGYIPDLEDPATVGCLLALAREAFHRPGFHVVKKRRGPAWSISNIEAELIYKGETEAEALVVALESFGKGTA